MKGIIIECVICHHEFGLQEIKDQDTPIDKTITDTEKFREHVESTGVMIDCPGCEQVMYVSDCQIY